MYIKITFRRVGKNYDIYWITCYNNIKFNYDYKPNDSRPQNHMTKNDFWVIASFGNGLKYRV